MHVRKLIAHGPSSLTIALPHKWVKRYGLHKGDTVAIDEDEQGLRVSAKPSEHKRAIGVDLTGHDWPAILTVLTTVYRRGYDEISVRYAAAEEYQHVSSAVRLLLGSAIAETGRGRCLIKCLPTELEQDFPTLFRRVFLMLLQELDDIGEIIDKPAALKSFYRRDADLNALVNLALRMINKGQLQDRFDELHLFHALLVLEECGDDLVKFSIEARGSKDAAKLREHLKHCGKMLRMLYEGYFQGTAGIMDFYRQYYLYWPDAPDKQAAPVYESFAKAPKGAPVFYLRSIIEKIVQLAEMLLLPQAKMDA
jgi:phosphate uptake regulator